MQQFLYLAQTFDSSYSTSTTTTSSTGSDGAAFALLFVTLGIFMIPLLVMVAIQLAGMWKVFTKAKQPGWAVIIPIYNMYILQLIVGRPGWWAALYLVPGVNFIIGIINSVDLVKSFGKDPVYALLLVLAPVIGYPMLGFGSAQYVGPSVPGANPGNPGVSGTIPPQPTPVQQPSAPTPQPITEDKTTTPDNSPTPPQTPLV